MTVISRLGDGCLTCLFFHYALFDGLFEVLFDVLFDGLFDGYLTIICLDPFRRESLTQRDRYIWSVTVRLGARVQLNVPLRVRGESLTQRNRLGARVRTAARRYSRCISQNGFRT